MENERKENKISIRQLMIIYVMSIAPSVIRTVPTITASIAKQASWVTTFALLIFFVPLLYVLFKMISIGKETSLEDAYEKAIGKIPTKILLAFYIIWIFIVSCVNLRYFAERFTASILIETPIEFFYLTLLIIVFIVARKNIEYFARFNEIFIIFFIVFFALMLVIPISSIKIENLFPVTTMDIVPIFKSVYGELGIGVYITFILFIGNKISDKENMNKHILYQVISVVIVNTVLILSTVGIFGAKATAQLSLPFFTFLKSVNEFSIIERIESIFISLWVATDFTALATFVFIITKLIKKTFNLTYRKELVTPIVFGIYIFSQYLAGNINELTSFSHDIALYVNIFLGFVIPIVIYVIGKIRKVF